jgi:hypothetical protein
VRLAQLVPSELDHGGVRAEQAIRAHGIKLVIETEVVVLFGYRFLE